MGFGDILQTSMNALLLKTWVGASTSASTLWAATTATAQQDSLYQGMREHAKVGKQINILLAICNDLKIIHYQYYYSVHVHT